MKNNIFSLLLLSLISFLDLKTNLPISYSLFYLFPLMICVWNSDFKYSGYIYGLIVSLINYYMGIVDGRDRPWNILVFFSIYSIITWLIIRVKELINKEKNESRIDFLTEIRNRRGFSELVNLEIHRFKRFQRPFALVYIDIDNFKFINNMYGHKEGDKVLKEFAKLLQSNIREIDFCGRLGGDEFAILFLEVDDSINVILEKISELFLQIFNKYDGVSLSIGAVVYKKLNNETVDELINIADKEMYSIKNTDKNGIKIKVVC